MGDPGHKSWILETVGCGAAFIDYGNDGWLDIFVLSGTRLEGAPEATNRLYRNNRNGTFTDVTDEAGLRLAGWASSVAVADYNNDGFDDLFVTCWGQNALYRNNGDGTFTDVTKAAGLLHDGKRWGSGCTFVDYDRNGHLDLFVANYLEFDFESVPKPGANSNCNWKGIPVICGPQGLPPGSASLYRNNGDGTFSDVSIQSGISKATGSYMMTATSADFDNDGWPDIYVACDSSPSFLLHNNHDGTFTDAGLDWGVALNEDGQQQAGMGIGLGDFNLDGNLDILKTHFADDTSVLYRNSGKKIFDDVTSASGLGVETRFVGWGAGIVDLDNDGFPDLFMVTGGVYPEVEKRLAKYPMKTPRVVFRNLGNGKFEQLIDAAGPGVAAPHCSRGCAFGDFDNDGDVDVLIVNLNEPPSLLRNDMSGSNRWLKVKLIGVKSNRGAIGARVTAHYGGKVQAQEVLSQSSFYSASDSRLHFGLGAAESADLEIRWPNGGRETLRRVMAGQLGRCSRRLGNRQADEVPQSRYMRRRSFLSAVLAQGIARPLSAGAHRAFEDVAAKAGIRFRHAASKTTQKYLPESMGAGVAMLGGPVSACFVDYDRDGWLDLIVTRYFDWDFSRNIYCGEKRPGYRAYCHPNEYQPTAHLVFHNNGDGTFTDVSKKCGLDAVPSKGLGIAINDFDRDGWRTSWWRTILFPNNFSGVIARYIHRDRH